MALTRTFVAGMCVAASFTLGSGIARAEPEACAPTERLEPFRFLRQLSLDLRGRIPTEAEYERVRRDGDVTASLVAEMVESDEAIRYLRGFHRERVWGSLDEVDVVSNRRQLSPRRLRSGTVWTVGQQARLYRGGDRVGCVDFEHDRFDADGHALPLVEGYTGGPLPGRLSAVPPPDNAASCRAASPCRLDGWVRVHPYWAPESEVRVCAFDAQTAERGLARDDRACTADVVDDPGCGCGRGLRFCAANGDGGSHNQVRAALVEEPLRIFEDVVRNRRSYFDALRTKTTQMDGRVAFYYRNLSTSVVQGSQLGVIPDLDWSERTWRPVERGPEHAGILTTQLYLTRFANPRARANRFYQAFLCEPFESPPEGLPPATDPCSSDPNLMTRCGCADCHARLEPAAAFFGRWQMGPSYGHMSTMTFPDFDMRCATCVGRACNGRCNTYYVTEANTSHHDERALLGQLRVAAWLSPEQRMAIAVGPRGLLERPGAIERMSACVARTVAERLLHRDLHVDELAEWVPRLSADFAASGHDFLTLLEAVVTDPRYRAIR